MDGKESPARACLGKGPLCWAGCCCSGAASGRMQLARLGQRVDPAGKGGGALISLPSLGEGATYVFVGPHITTEYSNDDSHTVALCCLGTVRPGV